MIAKRAGGQRQSVRFTLLAALSLTLLFLSAPVSAEQATATESAAADVAGYCSEKGSYEICLTHGGTEDRLIAAKIKAKIDATADAAQSGDYIRVAMYQWRTDGGGTAVADSLVRAKERGVSVRVVMGAGNLAIKGKLEGAGIEVNVCPDACMPPNGGAMHNKFFVIKKGDTKLVMQTSTNFSSQQATHAQNLLISRDDSELFSHYVNYWRRLFDKSWTWEGVTWSEQDRNRYGTNDLSRVYFFPQETKDPLTGILGKVSECSSSGSNLNNRIWVEASLFDASERSEVVRELKRLRDIGCDVKIVVQKQVDVDSLLAHGITSADIRCDKYNHSKLLLIDAKYAGEYRKAVFVGSYNINNNSTHAANDAMLRVINGWVTNRYIDHFRVLWGNTHGCE